MVLDLRMDDGVLGFDIFPKKDEVFVLNKNTKRWRKVKDLTTLTLFDIIYIENKVNHERYLDQDGNLTFKLLSLNFISDTSEDVLEVTATPCSTTN